MLYLPTYAHFCGEVRVEQNCCADEKHSNEDKELAFEASCCSDVALPVVADREHQPNQEINWTINKGFAVQIPTLIRQYSFSISEKTISLLHYYHQFTPPIIALYKMYKQYIVYQ